MSLLERAKALAFKIEEGISQGEDIYIEAEEEFEVIAGELLNSNNTLVDAFEVMKVLSEIPDPEDESTKLWMLTGNFQDCIDRIATPLYICRYLLETGKEESEKVVFNGAEMTIKELMEFLEIIEMKKNAICHSFFTEGKINDTNESLNLNLFKKI